MILKAKYSAKICKFLQLFDGWTEPVKFGFRWTVFGFFWLKVSKYNVVRDHTTRFHTSRNRISREHTIWKFPSDMFSAGIDPAGMILHNVENTLNSSDSVHQAIYIRR